MSHLPSIDIGVAERLKTDPEFRREYFLAESSAMIARQLIMLRKRRGLSQHQVADELNTQQPAISRVESADYRNWSFNTLRKLADALGARLRVSIEPFEDVVGDYAETRQAPAHLASVTDLQKLFGVHKSEPPVGRSLLEQTETGLGMIPPQHTTQTVSSVLENEKTSRSRPQGSRSQGNITGAAWNSLDTTSLV
ncbi:helix-turn-helix transcriptional regulator [Bradyrhizobium sp. BWC-3-1]|uniref:helix-turn-helix transcriptional regulator n=1 Tax=Bradyrhizobium sp. BWC-3-1 TaxID=3080012 RepID=UPI00293F1844|nr:helix-turn-helix transcriptional regulator [Bradyrhizobium sp. BWC-3-1]WOH55297.1 helix-turn-helix transcriptional regulator [Bradyrhizobium sp. BWC-3-1]